METIPYLFSKFGKFAIEYSFYYLMPVEGKLTITYTIFKGVDGLKYDSIY